MTGPLTEQKRQFRFRHGDVVATRSALMVLKSFGLSALPLLIRHLQGDWGNIGAADYELNERALTTGGRLFSSYDLTTAIPASAGSRPRVWIVTEHDRSVTTICLPEDY